MPEKLYAIYITSVILLSIIISRLLQAKRKKKSIFKNNTLLRKLNNASEISGYNYDNKNLIKEYESILNTCRSELEHAKNVLKSDLSATKLFAIALSIFQIIITNGIEILFEMFDFLFKIGLSKYTDETQKIILLYVFIEILIVFYHSIMLYIKEQFFLFIIEDKLSEKRDINSKCEGEFKGQDWENNIKDQDKRNKKNKKNKKKQK